MGWLLTIAAGLVTVGFMGGLICHRAPYRRPPRWQDIQGSDYIDIGVASEAAPAECAAVDAMSELLELASASDRRFLEIQSILYAVIRELPVAFIAVDAHGDVLITSNEGIVQGSEDVKQGSPVPSWGDLWELRKDGAEVTPDQWPIARALAGERVDPAVYCSISKGRDEQLRHKIWATPLRAHGKTAGAIVFFEREAEVGPA